MWSDASLAAQDVWRRPGHREMQVAARRAAWARIANGEGFIYCAEMIGRDEVKIGFSLNPERRVTDLNSKARLLATVPASITDERILHRMLNAELARPKSEYYPRSILTHPAIPAELRRAA